ncbi:MAG: hypothetical protein O3A37_00485 [Planctomycetota bacterium]|jgi:hypothetical protein|nr:hypothetical protein [Planctomycetota bacterium]
MMVPLCYAFEISLHRHPAEDLRQGSPHTDVWGTWPTVSIPHEMLVVPLAISFDDCLKRLETLERMFVEPDGSFVWVSPREGLRWQVDGNVFDRNGRVLLIDMRGSCPADDFERLLTCCGWPAEKLVFQLVRPAVFLEEYAFRQHAEARGAIRSA